MGVDNILTLFAVDVFLDGGAVSEIRPEVRTGDLLSSFAKFSLQEIKNKQKCMKHFITLHVQVYMCL